MKGANAKKGGFLWYVVPYTRVEVQSQQTGSLGYPAGQFYGAKHSIDSNYPNEKKLHTCSLLDKDLPCL